MGTDGDVAFVEVLNFARDRTAADAENAATTAEVVHRREVFGKTHRVPLRNDVEHRAQADLAGARRDPGVQQQAVRDDLVSLMLKVMLGGPEAVVTHCVSRCRGLYVLERRVPAGRVVEAAIHWVRRSGARIGHLDAAEEERSKLHVATP